MPRPQPGHRAIAAKDGYIISPRALGSQVETAGT